MRPASSDWRPVEEVAEVLSGFDRPWGIAGGWAIDLFLGRRTRAHEDVDVGVLRRDQRALRGYLPRWEFRKATHRARGRLLAWPRDEWLDPPIHEVHVRSPRSEGSDFEILLEESDGDRWRFRHHPSIERHLSDLTTSGARDHPILRPEIVLLYKAKAPTATDEADFRRTCPHLDDAARSWLASALTAVDPSSAWLPRLRRPFVKSADVRRTTFK
jgi:hypothetical protein